MVTMIVDFDVFFALFAILSVVHFLIDINYIVTNLVIIYVWGPLMRKEKKPTETTYYYGICTANDLDACFDHMNVSRYARELDFATLHFSISTGLCDAIAKAGGTVIQGVSHITYKEPIPFLKLYRIRTKMIHWDEKSIYFEHEFVTLWMYESATTVLSKQGIVGANGYEVINGLVGESAEYRPEMPPYLEEWLKRCESPEI